MVTVGTGSGRKATGNVTFSLFPTAKLTFTNSTAINNMRTEGTLRIHPIEQRHRSNSSARHFNISGSARYRKSDQFEIPGVKWIGFFAGYHYSDRLITRHASTLGRRLLPDQHSERGSVRREDSAHSALTIVSDGEVGRANQPFTPKSDKDYQALERAYNTKEKPAAFGLFAIELQQQFGYVHLLQLPRQNVCRQRLMDAAAWLSFNADYVEDPPGYPGRLSYFRWRRTAHERVFALHQQSANGQSRERISR